MRDRARGLVRAATAAALVVAAACGGEPAATPGPTRAPGAEPQAAEPHAATPAPRTAPTPSPTSTETVVEVPIRLVRAVDDEATQGFAAFTAAVLRDTRGWERAGFRFTFTDDAEYTVVLAEGDEVDHICHPYTTEGRFSCQMGPVVALNADRWREATKRWPGSLEGYRTMLVNHEVGHLLGQNHPHEYCGEPGAPAAVMAQQSGGPRDCVANPWPLDWEIVCAARHEKPLAPGYEPDAQPSCGPGTSGAERALTGHLPRREQFVLEPARFRPM